MANEFLKLEKNEKLKFKSRFRWNNGKISARVTGGYFFSAYNQKMHKEELFKLVIVKPKNKSLKYEKKYKLTFGISIKVKQMQFQV